MMRPETIPDALALYADREQPAVVCGGEKISFRALAEDARHIAGVLVKRGVQRGDRVVLVMRRSLDYTRAYMGVIMAGGIQVTIHSAWPTQQRELVYADCNPVMTLDDSSVSALLAEPTEDAVLPELDGDDPFQIVYTSGSTGKPKGVVSFHRVLVDNILPREGYEEEYTLLTYVSEHCRRILCDASLAFILATGQLLRGLLSGVTVVMATDEELQSPAALAACITRSGVDEMLGVPSRFYRYLDDPDFAAALRGLHCLTLSGETAETKVIDILMDHTDAPIRYQYCSSESATATLGGWCRRGEEPLLVPSRCNPVYVLDGEMCVGGSAGRLGRYWNDEALTKEKYFIHPEYGRLFRSGDRACVEPDGRLRTLGRTDGMVKLRGQRVELGAIEKVMERMPGITRAAARLQGEGPQAVLCGYYCGSVDQGALRRYMADNLPWYMVPGHLQELPELPMNANGKLYRPGLPPIEIGTSRGGAPETDAEKMLCEAFTKVLGRPAGPEDSFLELGGDSVRAMEAVVMLQERGFELRTEWIFATPTARALGQMLLPLKAETEMTERPETRERPESELMWSKELTAAEKARLDHEVGLDHIEAVYPVFGEAGCMIRLRHPFRIVELFTVSAELTETELRRRLERSARCHQALRSAFVSDDGAQPLQVVLKEWKIPVTTKDLRSLTGAAQERELRELVRRYRAMPFSNDVMFEVVLLRLDEKRSALALAYSHLMLDGAGKARVWSELVGNQEAVSDVREYNHYIMQLYESGLTTEVRHEKGLTELKPGPAGKKGIHSLMMSAGNAFAAEAVRYCAETGYTFSTLITLALGRTLAEQSGAAEAGFYVMSSGRDAKCAHLTGMFARRFAVRVSGEDTPATLQERLMRTMRKPVPEVIDEGFHVILSMQNYPRPEGVLPLELLPGPGEVYDVPEAEPSKDITILVYPEAPLRIELNYDGWYYEREAVRHLARGLLTKLRQLIKG